MNIDVLFFEATPRKLEHIMKRVEEGRTYVPLLNADISKIIHAARANDPSIIFGGIEETKRQRVYRYQYLNGSREESIKINFWNKFRTGKCHVVLFGALHCTNKPDWLFGSIRNSVPLSIAVKMLNIRVLGEHQDGPLEAFIFFLDQIGFEHKDFVIPDTSSLHPLIYEWFLLLTQQTLKQFHTLIVFRNFYKVLPATDHIEPYSDKVQIQN